MADVQISTLPQTTPDHNDLVIFVDVDDSNNAKTNTVEEIVKEGMTVLDSDDLSQGTSNLFLTNAERSKLATVAPNSEPNEVESVNGKQGIVTLDLDEIPNWTNYVRSQNNFTNLQLTRVTNAENHRNNFSNPHNTTKAQVWLDQVKNVEQISSDPNEFSAFAHKTSPHEDDKILIENESDSRKKRYVTIWDILTEFFKPVVTRFKNSLELDVDDKVQLVGDEANPQHRYSYQTRNWAKMWASMMPENIVEATEELIIDDKDQYIVFGPLTIDWIISGDGDLVIL